MTDLKLAEELELSVKDAEQYGFHSIVLMNEDAKKIIAALRRVPDEIDAAYALRMVYLMLRSLRAEIPPGRSSMLDRDRLRNEVLDEVEARVGEMQASENLRSERPPFGEMVMVPRELGELAQDIVATMERQPGYKLAITHGRILRIAKEICRLYELSKLSAAEAEGRKS